jgi:hypothetical protein
VVVGDDAPLEAGRVASSMRFGEKSEERERGK